MIFRAVAFDEINPVAPAEKPDPKRHQWIDSMLEGHRNHRRPELARFDHYFARRIANQPGPMAVRIEPINFQTSTILLSAPTAAALEMK
jgi:hypothetical protein